MLPEEETSNIIVDHNKTIIGNKQELNKLYLD